MALSEKCSLVEDARSQLFHLNYKDCTQDFIDEDEVFPNHLFTDLPTKISDDYHNPVKEFEQERR